MQNFSPLALKLREEFENYAQTYCKNANFLTAPFGTKILLLIFTEIRCSRGINLLVLLFLTNGILS